MTDYISFCKSYFEAVNIPMVTYCGDKLLYSSIAHTLSLHSVPLYEFVHCTRNPEFCMYHSNTMYGRLQIEGTDYHIVLGPAYNIPVGDSLLREYMHENAILSEHRDQLGELLQNIPTINYAQFLKHLLFLHQCLNHKMTDVLTHFGVESEIQSRKRTSRYLDQTFEYRENAGFHNSYYYEQGLYQHIKAGDTVQLTKYLQNTAPTYHEGHMADTPLRQSKNIFIGTVTKIAMLGAIPGGMDIEQAYQLIDLYSQECERLNTLHEIESLHYSMLIDFCSRVGDNQVPDGLSREVHICITFIRNHTNEDINIDDVAKQINRSTSYTIKRFKDELNINIGAFITRCKLEEAKSLLAYSNKPLSEISAYLCFSSQSYFQNVFKKKYGVTPMQYRKQHQI